MSKFITLLCLIIPVYCSQSILNFSPGFDYIYSYEVNLGNGLGLSLNCRLVIRPKTQLEYIAKIYETNISFANNEPLDPGLLSKFKRALSRPFTVKLLRSRDAFPVFTIETEAPPQTQEEQEMQEKDKTVDIKIGLLNILNVYMKEEPVYRVYGDDCETTYVLSPFPTKPYVKKEMSVEKKCTSIKVNPSLSDCEPERREVIDRRVSSSISLTAHQKKLIISEAQSLETIGYQVGSHRSLFNEVTLKQHLSLIQTKPGDSQDAANDVLSYGVNDFDGLDAINATEPQGVFFSQLEAKFWALSEKFKGMGQKPPEVDSFSELIDVINLMSLHEESQFLDLLTRAQTMGRDIERHLPFYVRLLAATGSFPAFKVVRFIFENIQLPGNREVFNDEMASFFTRLSFHANSFGAEFEGQFVEFCRTWDVMRDRNLKEKCWLSFSALFHEKRVKPRLLSGAPLAHPEVRFDLNRVILSENWSWDGNELQNQDSRDILLAIKIIRNLGAKSGLQLSFLRGVLNKSPEELRAAAALALGRVAESEPDAVKTMASQLLLDREEGHGVRIPAFLSWLKSEPTLEDLQGLAKYMLKYRLKEDRQVLTFLFSSLRAMAESTSSRCASQSTAKSVKLIVNTLLRDFEKLLGPITLLDSFVTTFKSETGFILLSLVSSKTSYIPKTIYVEVGDDFQKKAFALNIFPGDPSIALLEPDPLTFDRDVAGYAGYILDNLRLIKNQTWETKVVLSFFENGHEMDFDVLRSDQLENRLKKGYHFAFHLFNSLRASTATESGLQVTFDTVQGSSYSSLFANIFEESKLSFDLDYKSFHEMYVISSSSLPLSTFRFGFGKRLREKVSLPMELRVERRPGAKVNIWYLKKEAASAHFVERSEANYVLKETMAGPFPCIYSELNATLGVTGDGDGDGVAENGSNDVATYLPLGYSLLTRAPVINGKVSRPQRPQRLTGSNLSLTLKLVSSFERQERLFVSFDRTSGHHLGAGLKAAPNGEAEEEGIFTLQATNRAADLVFWEYQVRCEFFHRLKRLNVGVNYSHSSRPRYQATSNFSFEYQQNNYTFFNKLLVKGTFRGPDLGIDVGGHFYKTEWGRFATNTLTQTNRFDALTFEVNFLLNPPDYVIESVDYTGLEGIHRYLDRISRNGLKNTSIKINVKPIITEEPQLSDIRLEDSRGEVVFEGKSLPFPWLSYDYQFDLDATEQLESFLPPSVCYFDGTRTKTFDGHQFQRNPMSKQVILVTDCYPRNKIIVSGSTQQLRVIYNNGLDIKLIDHLFTVNGEIINLKPRQSISFHGVKVSLNDGWYEMHFPNLIQVSSREGSVVIKSSRYFKSRLCGVCGNFDGDWSNEMMVPNGELVPNEVAFVASWETPSVGDMTADAKAAAQALIKVRRPDEPQVADLHGHRLDNVVGPLNVGDQLSLICTTRGGNPPPVLSWWRGYTMMDHSFEYTHENVSVNKLTLVLNADHHMAVLTCQAANSMTAPSATSVTLHVNDFAPKVGQSSQSSPVLSRKTSQNGNALQVPKIRDLNGNELKGIIGPFEEEDELKLVCLTKGGEPRPSLTWFRDSTMVDNSFEYSGETEVVTINHLRIESLSRDHLLSTLTCEASNNNRNLPLASQVVIDMNLKPANVRITHFTATLEAEKEARFKCISFGSRPKALLYWIFDGQRIDSPATGKPTDDFSETMLTLTLRAEDSGAHLSCFASNPLIANSALSDKLKLRVY